MPELTREQELAIIAAARRVAKCAATIYPAAACDNAAHAAFGALIEACNPRPAARDVRLWREDGACDSWKDGSVTSQSHASPIVRITVDGERVWPKP